MSENDRDNEKPDENDPLGNLFRMIFGQGGMPGQSGAGQQSGQSGMPGMSGMNIDPAMLGGIMSQLQGMFSGAGGGVKTAAVRAAEAKLPTPDPQPGEEAKRTSADAFRVAELWLGGVTEEPAGVPAGRPLSRKQWVEDSAEGWLELVGPIRENMSEALLGSLGEQVPEEMKPMLAHAGQMLGSMTDMMFGAQLGELLGALSGSVLTGTEFGPSVMRGGEPVLVESNIAGQAAESGLDTAELRIYLAATELAHLWLFARVPWLAGHVRTALAKYADGIEVDTERIQGMAAGGLDPSQLEQMGEELRQGMFRPQPTADQREALETLQTVLSVIAGWADVVAYAACAQLEQREEIRTALRERAAAQSPADVALSDFIGLNLQPARLREAISLFAYLESTKGAEARDDVFRHPDMLPTAADLDDPLGYYERRSAEWSADSSMDEALERLLSEESGTGAGAAGTADSGPAESGRAESEGSGEPEHSTDEGTGRTHRDGRSGDGGDERDEDR
ncbi:zinc-dependent metalloprotease [Brevibacterium sp. BRM-1]|uniref:zinc-dependent metalloprotease n=1 Tax=Brevibacterium sp. BRM-1 TaxID=2999062 RepID=UPI002280CE97|nr:zinc-dependent metalloprotease [Brevibacterium sp. BRM-1]WAL40503.1 zinc-dependent metalloprotease [Brevibacterium sp. BRM-1]